MVSHTELKCCLRELHSCGRLRKDRSLLVAGSDPQERLRMFQSLVVYTCYQQRMLEMNTVLKWMKRSRWLLPFILMKTVSIHNRVSSPPWRSSRTWWNCVHIQKCEFTLCAALHPSPPAAFSPLLIVGPIWKGITVFILKEVGKIHQKTNHLPKQEEFRQVSLYIYIFFKNHNEFW